MQDNNIETAIKRTETLLAKLNIFREFYKTWHFESAYKYIASILFNAEAIPLALRKLPYSLAYNDETIEDICDEIYKTVAENCGIQIEMTNDGIFCVRLPQLLPRVKGRMQTSYVRDTLFLMLKRYHNQYWLENKAEPDYSGLKPCFIVVKHIFDDKQVLRRQLIDYDNFDQKQAIDMITYWTIGDDSPAVCDVIMCAGYGETASAEIRLIPADKFMEWFQNDMKTHLMLNRGAVIPSGKK